MTPLPVKALVVVRRPADGALLVAAAETDDFDRPLGGHVEFGELAEDTARREIHEEIAQEIRDLRLLGVIENRFVLDGRDGHEIVFLFEAAFVDPVAYEIEEQGIRDELTGRTRVTWRRVGESGRRLVPEGIAAYL